MSRKQTTGNFSLTDYDDIFNVGEIIDSEYIVEIALSDLYPPEFHPFHVTDNEAMYRLAESVRQYGVREPGLARPRVEGGYELLCGNRRKRACELAGRTAMPIIVRNIDDASAVLIMVDSNLDHRDRILPSEKAWAYKVMMGALNHRGVKGERHSFEIMVERTGESKNQIFRMIRLTELIVTLADMVDANQLAFNPAVELSCLTVMEQTAVADVMARLEVKPSLSQAQRMKKASQDSGLTLHEIESILSKPKKPQRVEHLTTERLREYFPTDYSPDQMESVIIELLTAWKKRMAS